LPLLTLGEHYRRLLLFGGQDLELFLLFSDAHRQPLGTLAGSLSAAVSSAQPRCADASSIDPQRWSKVKGVLELIIPAGLQRCLSELPSGLS